MSQAATIYALASAPGKSGVAVFRISGPDAAQALRILDISTLPAPRLAQLVTLRHAGAVIDQALVVRFAAPHSFTGEDIVELHTHGSPAVTRLLLDILGTLPGLRLAGPGEFTRRAFLNGKLDLAQAEGLADLIDAETEAQHRQAMRQMGGDTSARIAALREQIVTPLALLEAYIDFPDEEIPAEVLDETTRHVTTLAHNVAALLDDGGVGEKIRAGMEVIILGAPNAGKSSLLNALARRDAAIVSAQAGTTRDLIEVPMNMAGYAVTLVDTAGLREAAGEIEAEGIRRAHARAAMADLKLLLVDSVTIADPPREILDLYDDQSLILATKSDLAPLPEGLAFSALPISTRTGAGMDQFIQILQEHIEKKMQGVPSPLITRARHREALTEALHHLRRFSPGAAIELNGEELRLAAQAIGKITGKIWVDDVLDLVFSRFCIGK